MRVGRQFVTTTVVSENGVINPSFTIDSETGHCINFTSGSLKYFFPLARKRVKITIEILEDEGGGNAVS